MQKFIEPLTPILLRPLSLIFPLLLSLLGQVFLVLCLVALGHYTGHVMPTNIYFVLVPLGVLTTTLPITPAGLGVGQAAFYYLFEMASGLGEFGVLAVSFLQCVQFVLGLLGGVLFTLYDRIYTKDVHG